jgi:nicotinamide-nucleotide amidase
MVCSAEDKVPDSDLVHAARENLRVGVISVGDEILEGRIVDLHSRTTSALLTPLGVEIGWHLSIGDAPGVLSSALASIPAPVDGIVIAGGLGPTEDDRSRQEIATATAAPLEFDEEAWQRIRDRLVTAGVEPAHNNRNQAFRPRGSETLVNDWGTAPGFRMSFGDGTLLFALPGVPSEFDQMLREYVLPWAQSRSGKIEAGEILEFIGIPESKLDEWILTELGGDGGHHICVKGWGQIEVRLPAGVSLREKASDRFGARFVGEGGIGAEWHLVKAAADAGVTLSTAESCTGGMIGSRITAVAGCSEVYLGGWVCYSYEAKTRELGVDPTVIEVEGAVSAAVVEAMASGARDRSGSDLAIAVSGIAGPGGATDEKPVGTVWMALCGHGKTDSHRYQLSGTRDRIRQLTTNLALQVVMAAIRQQEIPGWSKQRS